MEKLNYNKPYNKIPINKARQNINVTIKDKEGNIFIAKATLRQ